jgi:uncharacterized membrane protein
MNQAAQDPTLYVFVNLSETARMGVLAVAAATVASGFEAYIVVVVDVVERRMQMGRVDWARIHKPVGRDWRDPLTAGLREV